MRQAGTFLIVIGVVAIAVGLLVRFAGGWLSWFGHLPGDIRVEGKGGSFYAPIASMLLVSIVASLIVNLVARLFRGE